MCPDPSPDPDPIGEPGGPLDEDEMFLEAAVERIEAALRVGTDAVIESVSGGDTAVEREQESEGVDADAAPQCVARCRTCHDVVLVADDRVRRRCQRCGGRRWVDLGPIPLSLAMVELVDVEETEEPQPTLDGTRYQLSFTDRAEAMDAMNGSRWKHIASALNEYLRRRLKYETTLSGPVRRALEAARQELGSVIEARGLSLD